MSTTVNETQANQRLAARASAYLRAFCLEMDNRRVGAAGNRAATDFFANTVASFGFAVESSQFNCLDWRQEGVTLKAGATVFTAYASPYALGCRVEAPLTVIGSLAELEAADLVGKIVALRGEIASEQLTPKNFPFYNLDHHQRIINLLESKRPSAIIAATTRNEALVGGLYPFPLIEDGDFDIPSVYLTAEEGERLVAHAGQPIFLESRAERIPAVAAHIMARKGAFPGRRIVLFAHIDAKIGTPGAADNAAGVVVALLLAETLATYNGDLGVEIVPLNGEDYYGAPGQQLYLAANAAQFDDILLGINVDGAGFHRGPTAYSLYNCDAAMSDFIRGRFAPYGQIVPGEPWYAGDHALFLMNRRPTLALTTSQLPELLSLAHTAADTPDIVDAAQLTAVAAALGDLIIHFPFL